MGGFALEAGNATQQKSEQGHETFLGKQLLCQHLIHGDQWVSHCSCQEIVFHVIMHLTELMLSVVLFGKSCFKTNPRSLSVALTAKCHHFLKKYIHLSPLDARMFWMGTWDSSRGHRAQPLNQTGLCGHSFTFYSLRLFLFLLNAAL